MLLPFGQSLSSYDRARQEYMRATGQEPPIGQPPASAPSLYDAPLGGLNGPSLGVPDPPSNAFDPGWNPIENSADIFGLNEDISGNPIGEKSGNGKTLARSFLDMFNPFYAAQNDVGKNGNLGASVEFLNQGKEAVEGVAGEWLGRISVIAVGALLLLGAVFILSRQIGE